ncbi:MAG: TIM barrel protein [Candidatus Latescibacteria bacterium]|nr:TIM barrel protein [Candidatus Latescibacterota bacterium]
MTAHYTAVATQVYVWLQMYRRQQRSLEEHLDDVLGEVRTVGFDAFEGWLTWCSTPAQTQELGTLLGKHGLQLACLYHSGVYHEREGAEKMVAQTSELSRRARDIGCPSINVNPDPIGRDKTDEELKIQGEFLNRIAQELRGIGLRFTVHNHTPEMRNDAREHRANLTHTDADLVGFCLDLHWVLRGGQDPIAILRETGGRTQSLHLRNAVNGVWSETLGDGEIEYRRVSEVLHEIDYRGPLIVELAYEQETRLTRTLIENERLAREYVKRVFGV